MRFLHVLKLSSGYVVKGFTKVLEDNLEDWEPPLLVHVNQSYTNTVAHNPITLGHAVV